MAGGINLPFNIGVGPVQGGMTFAPNEHDPFTTMLKAYGLGQQGIGQGIQNQAMAEELPFAAEKSRLGMDKLRAEIANLPVDARYKEAMAARAYHAINNPTIGGDAGQVKHARELLASKDPNDRFYGQMILDSVVARQNSHTTPAERTAAGVTAAFKSQELAEFAELGVDATKAESLRRQGITPQAYALSIGKTPQEAANLIGNHPNTGAQTTRIKDMVGSERELEIWTPAIVDAIKPYMDPSVPLFGFSGKQLFDTVADQNLEQRGKFYGAQILQMEIAMKRLRASGMPAGYRAIDSMMKHSMTDIEPVLAKQDPEAWAYGQQWASDMIAEGAVGYVEASSNVPEWMKNKKNKNLAKSLENTMQQDETLDQKIQRLEAERRAIIENGGQ